MGVISDAIDSLEDWCSNLFKDGVKSQFDNISSLLTDTFSQTTGSDGLVSTYLTSPCAFYRWSCRRYVNLDDYRNALQ